MIRVSNKSCLRRLGWQAMKAARVRNLVAVVAIALTTVLFTSLFTIALSINDGFQQSNFRQVGGTSHGGFKYLTQEQADQLKDDPLIEEYGLRRFLGMPTEVPFNKSHVELGYSDANQAKWMFCDPVEGRLPQEGTDEAATDTRVLELLGVEPVLGATFTIPFQVAGQETTQTFTLCGWWEYDEASTASHVLLPQSRVDQVLQQLAITPPAQDGMTGSWNMDVMLEAKKHLPDVSFMISNRANLEKCLRESDVIVNGIQWAKDRKDHIIYREDLKLMKKGAMIVDVACDDEGAVETCRSTTHDDPVYKEEGILHYCVDNIPSAFAQTASITLANATCPMLLQIADKGFKKAIEENPYLRAGMTCYDGKLTLKETALKQNRPWTDAEDLIKVW